MRVGYVRNAMGGVLFELADRLGYFRAEGITVDFLPFESPVSEVDPLVHGEIDVSVGAPSATLFNAMASGAGPRIVADVATDRPGFGMVPLLVRSDLVRSGRFKRLHDLKGMTIALNGLGSVTESTLNELLQSAGLRSRDVRVYLLGFEFDIDAFASKLIDAALLPEPAATQAVHQGVAVRIMGNDKFYPNQEIAVAAFSLNFSARGDVPVHFMRAYLRAARLYSDAVSGGRLHGPNAQTIVSTITEATTLKDRALAAQIVPMAANPDGTLDNDSIRRDLRYLQSRGQVHGSPSVEDLVNPSFARVASAQLGPYTPADQKGSGATSSSAGAQGNQSSGGGGNGGQTLLLIGMAVLIGSLSLVVLHGVFVAK